MTKTLTRISVTTAIIGFARSPLWRLHTARRLPPKSHVGSAPDCAAAALFVF